VEDILPQGAPVAGARRAHEPDSIRVRGLVLFTGGLIATIALVLIVLGLLLARAAHRPDRLATILPSGLASDLDRFPTPRLQRDPGAELVQLRADERRRATSSGWVDRAAGIAHIPIDRALDILAENGLPKVAAPPATPGAPPGTSIPPATKRESARPEALQDRKP
jgi:hypothetical protein